MTLDTAGKPDRPAAPPLSKSEQTKLLLRRAAERVVAESGIHALTTRAVAKRARQRNTSVVLYHFGDIDNLLWHTIQARAQEMEHERSVFLKQAIAENKTSDVSTLLRCLGKPIINITDENGDHIFARFLVQLYANNHPFSLYLQETITPEFPARSQLLTLLLAELEPVGMDRLKFLVPALTLMPLNLAIAHDIARKSGAPTPPLEELCESTYRLAAAIAQNPAMPHRD